MTAGRDGVSANITTIDKCLGCDRTRVVDASVPICMECLLGARRGRVWALRMHECRTNPRFARKVYDAIKTDHGRRVFMQAFGLPPRFEEEGDVADE